MSHPSALCDDEADLGGSGGGWCWLPRCIYYIEGVGILTVGLVGIAINLIAMKLLICAKQRHVFHNVLLSLTIYDLLQIRLGHVEI